MQQVRDCMDGKFFRVVHGWARLRILHLWLALIQERLSRAISLAIQGSIEQPCRWREDETLTISKIPLTLLNATRREDLTLVVRYLCSFFGLHLTVLYKNDVMTSFRRVDDAGWFGGTLGDGFMELRFILKPVALCHKKEKVVSIEANKRIRCIIL